MAREGPTPASPRFETAIWLSLAGGARLEDIVAEKLRGLLQQPLRNRARRQDLLDLAVVFSAGMELNRERVASYLTPKADARDVAVSRAALHDPEVLGRARQDYSALQTTTRVRFIPYDEALSTLHLFVSELPIPE